MSSSPLTRSVETYKALGHPVRLRLLAMLRGGELCVCQMTAVLGLAASTVSAHLSELRRAGLVAERKEGRWVRYRLLEGEEGGPLVEAAWPRLRRDPRLEEDAGLLRELRRVPVEELCRVDLDLGRLGIRRPVAARRSRR